MRWKGSQSGSEGLLLASDGEALDGTEDLTVSAFKNAQFSAGE